MENVIPVIAENIHYVVCQAKNTQFTQYPPLF